MTYRLILLFIFFIISSSEAQNIDFTDSTFKDVLLNQNCAEIVNVNGLVDVDTNNDGEIQVAEAEAVRTLNIANYGINDLNGIGFFINLTQLRAEQNNIESVDVTQLNRLTLLDLAENRLSSLDITDLPDLFSLYCNNNNLTSLKFRHFSRISDFIIHDNPNLGNLDSVALSRNRFSYMYVWNTGITKIDVSHMEFLTEFQVGNNRIKTLDLSKNQYIRAFSCQDSPLLESVNFKNGFNDRVSSNLFYATNCPNLKSICVDDVDYANENFVNVEAHTEFVASCDTVVKNYLIVGSINFDEGQNNCDFNSTPALNIKIEASSDSGIFTTYTRKNGTFKFSVPKGEYVVRAVLDENYLYLNPPDHRIVLNEINSTSTADFCIISNQAFNELEVGILPIQRTRQNSEVTYQINVLNNGSTAQSGDVKVEFDGTKQTFVSSNNERINQDLEEIIFSFTDLKPLGQKTFNLVLKTQGSPIVSEGDVLSLTAVLLDSENETTTENNEFLLELPVVSNDVSNDIRVLQGDEIQINQITDYLEYIVRFQNIEPSEATDLNLVINLGEGFDHSTFSPINFSHDNTIEIINNNFIYINFENINLASITDSTNNSEGFFAFKIKPDPTSANEGDILVLDADIYFDDEDAVRTNTAMTEIAQTLTVSQVNTAKLKVYPNPAQSMITISSSDPINEIKLYDLNGRKLKDLNMNESEVLLRLNIDMETTAKGIYYLVVSSIKGTETHKIIKN